MRGSASSAAASQATARSRAASGSIDHGCDRSRSGISRASVSGSGRPGALVLGGEARRCCRPSRRCRGSRCALRSPVLAEPLRLPRYTVTPMPRSRWYSSVSTSPQPRGHGQAGIDADADLGLARTESARLGERQRHQVLQVLLRVAELAGRAVATGHAPIVSGATSAWLRLYDACAGRPVAATHDRRRPNAPVRANASAAATTCRRSAKR